MARVLDLDLGHVNGDKIALTTDNAITVDGHKITAGSRSIIDNIPLWCRCKFFVLPYFECVCMVFQKYRVSFKLSKC